MIPRSAQPPPNLPQAPTQTVFISDQVSCDLNLGDWFNDSCYITGVRIPHGATWSSSVPVAFRGKVTIDGRWNVVGLTRVTVDGTLKIGSRGEFDDFGRMALSKGAVVFSDGLFHNIASQYSASQLTVSKDAYFINYGEVDIDGCFGGGLCSSIVFILNGGTYSNYGLTRNGGQISISCGGDFYNLDRVQGAGAIQDLSGPNCYPGGAPESPQLGVLQSTTSGYAKNSGTMVFWAGGSLNLGYNATFLNGGTMELYHGLPGAPFQPPVLGGRIDATIARAFVNNGKVGDAGNISGNVSGTGTVETFCGGSVYNSKTTGAVVGACDATSLSIPVAPYFTPPASEVGLRAIVTDTSPAPTAPTGYVSWDDGGSGGIFPTGSVCQLRPFSGNSSICTTAYTTPASNGTVLLNSSYDEGSSTMNRFAPSLASGQLTVGASQTIVLSGKSSCTTLGGGWNSSQSRCAVATLHVPSNVSLSISTGVSLAIGAVLNIDGAVVNSGVLSNSGTVTINGTLEGSGQITNSPSGQISNHGLTHLLGLMNSSGNVSNDGLFWFTGASCTGCTGGNLTNAGQFVNQFGGWVFQGVTSHSGSQDIENLARGAISNAGLWTSDGIVLNLGAFTNGVGAELLPGTSFTNAGNLSNFGNVSTGTISNDAGASLLNYHLADALSIDDLVGGVVKNFAGGILNLTAGTNQGNIANLAGGQLSIVASAKFTNSPSGVIKNYANGSVYVNGSLTNSGSLVNQAGAWLWNAGSITNRAAGLFNDSGTFSNFVYPIAVPGAVLQAGLMQNGGRVTSSGPINDTYGTLLELCGGSVSNPVIGQPAESLCGDRTAVTLTPVSVSGTINQSVGIHAVVTDKSKAPSNPTGVVTWTDGSADGLFGSAVCTLGRLNASVAACNITLLSSVPTEGGATAVYVGDSKHMTSTATSGFEIGGRPVGVVLRPAFASAPVNTKILLRTNVTDIGSGSSSSPSGPVGWTDGGAGGRFSGGGICTLSAVNSTTSTCSVSYTTPYLNENVTIQATYLADALHRGGSNQSVASIGVPCACHVLTSPSPQYSGNFGRAVSASGGRLLVGAIYENSSGAMYSGIAYVLNGSTGSVVATLTSPNAQSYAEFGFSVDLAGDLAVVGAPYEGSGSGYAYLFNATSGQLLRTWSSPHSQKPGYFGYAVGIESGTVVIGAPGEGAISNGTNVSSGGHAYIFSASTGKLLKSLQSPKPVFRGEFGYSVATDGGRVVVGQPDLSSGPGSAFLYNATMGKLAGKLSSPKGINGGEFGVAVAIGSGLVVIGALNEPGFSSLQGRAHSYNATTGVFVANFSSPKPVHGGEFGASVAVSGNVVVIGAPGESVYGHRNAGTAYEYSLAGTLVNSLVGPGEAYAKFGSAVSASGTQVAVAAPYQTVSGLLSAGRAYVF